jgi:nitrate reductase NapE
MSPPARRDAPSEGTPQPVAPSTRQEELRSFLFFTVVMAPVLAVVVVGGYGFLVWMYQLIAGPPTG